jgi:hypothetical protein
MAFYEICKPIGSRTTIFRPVGRKYNAIISSVRKCQLLQQFGSKAYCCDWICNRATLDGSTLDGSTLDKGDISAFSHLLYRPLRFSLSLFCWLVQHADEQLSREERIFTPPHFSQFQKLFPSRYLFFSMYRNYLSMLAPAAGGIYI